MLKLPIPKQVEEALTRLGNEGFESWLIGGVRDLLLGIAPHDWDITTAAPPEEIKRIFSDCGQNCAGEHFGTVCVMMDSVPMDITTFRKEGAYKDHRHPDTVTFTTHLFDDLKRRDFTVNAICYHPEKGIRDFFCGKRDLKKRLIRAIGDADKRFSQDALRILRAMRFSATLGFDIEEKTRLAIHRNKALLQTIPAERIVPELVRMICGCNIRYVLTEFSDVIGQIIPEVLPTVGFCQHSPFHQYDVWQHTVHALAYSDPTPEVRLALLFHDISKPGCLSIDHTGRGHFYAHPKKSSRIAKDVMTRLKFPTKTTDLIARLVAYHDSHPSSREDVKKLLRDVGEEEFKILLRVMEADTLAHSKWSVKKRLEHVRKIQKTAEDILLSGECFSLKSLAVGGQDLEERGVQGKRIGELLEMCLENVILGKWENKKEKLLFELEKNNW